MKEKEIVNTFITSLDKFENQQQSKDIYLIILFSGKSKLNESCDITEDCDNKGSICLRGRCRCHPHYIEVHDEKLRTTTCQIRSFIRLTLS